MDHSAGFFTMELDAEHELNGNEVLQKIVPNVTRVYDWGHAHSSSSKRIRIEEKASIFLLLFPKIKSIQDT